MQNKAGRNLSVIKKIFDNLNSRRKNQVYLILILNIISAFSESLSIIAFIPFINSLINNSQSIIFNYFPFINFSGNYNFKFLNVFIFLLLVITSGLLRLSNLYINQKIAALIGIDFSSKCFSNILKKDYRYHINDNSSNLINSLTSKIDTCVLTLTFIFNFFTFSLITTFIIFTLISIDIKICFFLILFIGGSYFYIGKTIRKKIRTNGRKIITNSEKLINTIQESLGFMKEIIIYNGYKMFIEKFTNYDQKRRITIAQNSFLGNAPKYILEIVGLFVLSLYSYYLIANNSELPKEYIITTIGSFALGAQKLLPSSQILFISWSGINMGIEGMQDILKLLEYEKFSSLKNTKNYRKGFKKIILKDISFSYLKNERKILNEINLEINKGDFIGIIGKTGSGKSTLIDLILGIIKAEKGDFLIDQISLYEERFSSQRLKEWRSNIAYVPQDIFLSSSSIAENIAFGIQKKEIDLKLLIKSAKISNIHETVENMTEKYNSLAGENGIKLSGGEKQRIGLARALYKKPKILVLDEATSALDEDTEEKILNSICNLNDNITVIMITHKLSSTKNCNKIIEIKNGKIYNKKN